MDSCCYADEYGDTFDASSAARQARQYLRRGLRGTARHLADGVAERGIAGATVLEVGGGVGGLHTHLLQHGASRAVNIELSPQWEPAARDVLAELDLTDRVTRRVGDVVDACDSLAPADVVVLHRVVCCYPDWQRMLDCASSRATRVIGLTVPTDRWPTRTVVRLGNGLLGLRGRRFRAFVHPVDELLAHLAARGFRPTSDRSGLVWRTIVLEHAAG